MEQPNGVGGVSNHTPSPPSFQDMESIEIALDKKSFKEKYRDYLINTPQIGQQYRNKHNHRIVEIVEHYVSDRGSIFYGIKSVDNDKDVIDYNTIGTMNTHWDLVESDEE